MSGSSHTGPYSGAYRSLERNGPPYGGSKKPTTRVLVHTGNAAGGWLPAARRSSRTRYRDEVGSMTGA